MPVRVTKTLIVPTQTVLTAVTVNKDLMETEKFAKVKLICRSHKLIHRVSICSLSVKSKSNQILITFLCASSDFDECSLEPSPCDENATCSNTDGSYSCTCRPGFSGNGSICKGMQ